MYTFENHPYLPFKAIVRRFADQNVPKGARSLFQAVVGVWRKIFRIDDYEQIIFSSIEQGKDGYAHDDWLWDNFFFPEISASLLADLPAAEPIPRAARIIYGAVQFMLKERSGGLETEVFSKRPQDMSRYRNFFSRLTISRLEGKEVKHHVTDCSPSNYIVIVINGFYFKLQVLDAGQAISPQQLQVALDSIVQKAQNLNDRTEAPYKAPIGILTALLSVPAVKTWQRFEEKNKHQIREVNEALFAFALDLDINPSGMDQSLYFLHAGRFYNRDFRRSFHVAIAGNGIFSIMVNPHAGIGGTLSARVISELANACQGPDMDKASLSQSLTPAVEYISFVDPKIDVVEITKFKDAIHQRLYGPELQTVFNLENVGADVFQARKMNVDAAFHAAMSLAWYRMRGFVPTIGNFINLRSVKFGDMWRYDATTYAMDEFVRRPNLENFRMAEKAHIDLIKKHKAANDEFYLGAMTLKRLICDGKVSFKSFVSLMFILSVFVRDFGRRFMNPNIWISCIPSYPGLKAVGRAGATMKFLARESSGGHYMVFKNHMVVCILNPPNGKWLGTEQEFASKLHQALREIAELQK